MYVPTHSHTIMPSTSEQIQIVTKAVFVNSLRALESLPSDLYIYRLKRRLQNLTGESIRISKAIEEEKRCPPIPKEMSVRVFIFYQSQSIYTFPLESHITTQADYIHFVKCLEHQYKDGSMFAIRVHDIKGNKVGFYPEVYHSWETFSKDLLQHVIDDCPYPKCTGHIASHFLPKQDINTPPIIEPPKIPAGDLF